MSFAGKVVLITGAGSGIGEAAAIAFARLSANLSLFDKNEETLKKVAEVCEKLSHKRVLKCIVNVAVDEKLREAVEDTLSEFGSIDVVVNCAGIFKLGSILDPNLMEAYDVGMNVNLRAIVYLTNLVVPSLIKSKGNIINITSTASKIVTSGWVPYILSKAALSQFTKCVALELASKGVRVNAIQPGPTKTNIGVNSGIYYDKDQNDKAWDVFGKSLPLGHCVEAKEIADLIVYIASDKAKSMTGGEYSVDAGSLLQGQQIASEF